jgi:hypothetical protein
MINLIGTAGSVAATGFDRKPRVLREPVVGLVEQAHREDAAAAAPDDLLVRAAVA